MKLKIFLLSLFTFLLSGNRCAQNNAPVTESEPTPGVSENMETEINFDSEIKPILLLRCSPCHFTGGKMYERLPFDKGETILNNSAGILKRIKDEAEAKKIHDFVELNTSKK